jgi:hypothetical protein
MTELLELEPRETAAEDPDVDTAFRGIVDAARDHAQCPHCCGDDVGFWFSANSITW